MVLSYRPATDLELWQERLDTLTLETTRRVFSSKGRFVEDAWDVGNEPYVALITEWVAHSKTYRTTLRLVYESRVSTPFTFVLILESIPFERYNRSDMMIWHERLLSAIPTLAEGNEKIGTIRKGRALIPPF